MNHIEGYESVEARLHQRGALYRDPAWVRDLVPLVSGTFVRLCGQLMALAPEAEATLGQALATDRDAVPVVASFLPVGATLPRQPGIGRWQMLTGVAGSGFALDYLADAGLEDTDGLALGVERQIWRSARFSAIQ